MCGAVMMLGPIFEIFEMERQKIFRNFQEILVNGAKFKVATKCLSDHRHFRLSYGE